MKLKNASLLKTQSYIDSRWVSPADNSTFDVINPYNGEMLAAVSDCGVSETKLAIDSAWRAFKIWKNYTAGKRSRILKNWYKLIIENLEDLSVILTMEQGKPLSEARGEIQYGASFVEWFAEEARRIYGDTIPGHQADKRIVTLKQPVGVVAAITPWNFPNAMITRKVAPALAAGCTCVIKPAELTPLSALALAQLADQAGFPPGVINIICSSRSDEIGKEMCANPLVRKLSFTGSTRVGKLLLKQCADTVKKVSMELGGNAPFIVFDDADIDAAVEGAISSKFRNAGQTCVCSNRIFVQSSVYDTFVLKFRDAITKLKVGNGLEESTVIGPLIDSRAVEFIGSLVNDAKSLGAKVSAGGNKLQIPGSDLFYEPTVLTDVNKNMKVFSEEIFGPIAPVFKFETEEEVIALANDTPYGLASYFYGRDYARIWRVSEALEYGMVGINTGMISTTLAPFGGIKESGFGREGSKYGMDDYLEIKYLCWGGIDSI